MASEIIEVGEGFWNIRGSFRIFGVVDIGTQMSLVRKADGRFVVLDGCGMDDAVAERVMARTEGGALVDAVLHLHPFHTIWVEDTHARFPEAKHYGTARHHRKAPDIAWEPTTTDDPATHALFADDLRFTVPRGVALIPDNENLHFSSVLAIHPASRTLHVDDTLMFSKLPIVGGVGFHPTLKQTLHPRAGAASEFRAWAEELIEACREVDHLCAAHTRPLLSVSQDGPPLSERVRAALDKVSGTLDAHARKHG